MLIVITRDHDIMDWAATEGSGAGAWGSLKQLSAGTQAEANAQMKQMLKVVKSNEPLCITGHGDDREVGDEGSFPGDWTWTHQELAVLLGGLVDFRAPILMEVCAESVTHFAAHLATSLEKLGKLKGVWIYGYIKSVDVKHKFPPPSGLDRNVELYPTQVGI